MHTSQLTSSKHVANQCTSQVDGHFILVVVVGVVVVVVELSVRTNSREWMNMA